MKSIKTNLIYIAGIIKPATIILLFSIFLINPCFSYDYYAAGKYSYNKNEYSKAYYYLKKSLKKHPGNLKCRYYFAQTLINLKDFESAQKQYEKIIEIAPVSREAKLASVGISQIQRYLLMQKGKLTIETRKTAGLRQKERILSVGDNYIFNALDGGKVTRWHSGKMPIKLYIERSVNVPGYKEYYYTTAKRAMDEWVNSVEGDLISYELVPGPKQADIQLYFVREIMKRTGKDFIAGLATPHIKEHILSHYDVKVVTQRPPGNRSFTEKEIYRTILHELGHALGIRGHSSQEKDIMYAGVETDPQHKNEGLSSRDINTLALLYTLDPDISNFNGGKIPLANSEKNQKILGSKENLLNTKLDEAIKYAQKYPDNALSWVHLGKAYHNLDDYSNAVKNLNKALQINPNYPNAIETLAFVYKDMKDFDKASEQFAKLVKIDPGNISYSHNYALYLIENKKYKQAREVLYNLRTTNPQAYANPDVKNLLDYLGRIN